MTFSNYSGYMGCIAPKPVKPLNMLLLGIGGVGKSTVFKQINLLYSTGFIVEARNEAKFVVYNSILETMEKIFAYGNKYRTFVSQKVS